MTEKKHKSLEELKSANLNLQEQVKETSTKIDNLQESNNLYLHEINMLKNKLNIVEDKKDLWTDSREKLAVKWLNLLKYHHLIYYFYVFKLKKIEGVWSWILIVLSALATTISAFQFHDDYYQVELASKISIILVTFFTTLIAAWVKKQGYIEKVSELDKYLLKIKKMIEHLDADIRLPRDVRIEFSSFIKKYKESIVEFNHTAPLISPDHWKETVYNITMFYPEKALELYPWDTYPAFSENIIDNYRFIKYNSFCKRLFSCYYCSSKCCSYKYKDKDFKEYTKELYRNKSIYNRKKKYDASENINKFLDPKMNLDTDYDNDNVFYEDNNNNNYNRSNGANESNYYNYNNDDIKVNSSKNRKTSYAIRTQSPIQSENSLILKRTHSESSQLSENLQLTTYNSSENTENIQPSMSRLLVPIKSGNTSDCLI